MATTSLWHIKGRLSDLIAYVENPEKTVPKGTEDFFNVFCTFQTAQKTAVEQLGQLAEKAQDEAGDEAALLFEIHQMLAEDLDYVEFIENAIKQEHQNVEAAVADTSVLFAEMFANMDDPYIQGRAADMKDVSNRILGILSGAVQGGIDSDTSVLLAADDLAPSETIQLDKSKILGFITVGGSGSSHTAILARTMGILAIAGVADILTPEYEGRTVIVGRQHRRGDP